MNATRREQFYYQLGNMISQGIDIRSSLEIFKEELSGENGISEVNGVLSDLEGGSSFSEALKNLKGITPTEKINIEIAEETGTLPNVLLSMSGYLKTRKEQKRLVVSAMAYPSLVILTAIGTILFMLAYIVPMFESVFKRVGGELPWLTQIIVDLSSGITNNIFLILISLFIVTVGIWMLRRNKSFLTLLDQLVVRIPLVGRSVLIANLAKFSGAMHLLLSNRQSLSTSLEHLTQMDLNHLIHVGVTDVQIRIIDGDFLYESMGRHRIFPRKMISMIRVGEESGSLDDTFRMLEKQYREEQRYQTSIIGSILEPALIIIVGLIVGVILIGMYLPMFQMSTAIQ